MGAGLAGRPRDEFVLSTKVGRLVRADADAHRPARTSTARRVDGRDDAFYADTRGPARRVRLQRGRRPALDRGEPRAARASTGSTSPTSTTPTTTGRRRSTARTRRSHRLREAGRRRRDRRRDEPVGDARPLRPRGRHRRDPARRPLHAARPGRARRPAAGCASSGASRCIVGGVMNSGVLADPRPGAAFDYAPAPPEVVERARRLRGGLRAARRPAPRRGDAVPARPSGRRRADRRASGRSPTSTSTRR